MKRVLILKIGAIGDVVMAMPMLTELKKNPATEITWIVGKTAAPLLHKTGLIYRLIEVDEEALFKRGFFSKVKEILKVWKKVGFRFFDLIICAHADPRYRFLTLPVRAKRKSFFTRGGKRSFPVPGRYHASEYLRLLKDHDDSTPLTPKFPNVKTTLPFHFEPIFSKKTIALAPGGAKNILSDDSLRRWPVTSYAKVAKHFTALDYQVLILGSTSDSWALPYFSGLTFINLIGKTNLLELVSVLKRTHLLITHDSGFLHLAKLAACRTLALFGPTVPWEKLSKNENILPIWGGEHLSCRPCYDGKKFAQCKKALCMENISVEWVCKEAESLLLTTIADPID